MSMLLFAMAALLLLAAPLVVLLVWAVVREQKNRMEWRDRALEEPMLHRDEPQA